MAGHGASSKAAADRCIEVPVAASGRGTRSSAPCPMRLFRLALLLTIGVAFALIATAVPPLPVKPDRVVAADGSGDFTSIHAAVQSIPRANRERTFIFVKDGVYTEQVRVDAPFVTLRGESRAGTRLEFSRADPDRTSGHGQAVLHLAATAHDFVLENFTVIHTRGPGNPAFTVLGLADRTALLDSDIVRDGHDTVSRWQGGAENHPAIDSSPPEGTRTTWREGGRHYHARLNVRGSVDVLSPGGWCFMRDSTITQANANVPAAIWHDGANNPDRKFVLRGCRFDGPPDWLLLTRRHQDAQFFLIDCSFSKAMRDTPPYRVVDSLRGGTTTAAARARNAHDDRTGHHGDRAYFFNSHREGGDYAWHADNLATAAGAPRPEQITAAWTFAHSWDPERPDAPRVTELRHQAQPDRLVVTFSEPVTVRGNPRLVFANGERAHLIDGSGSNTLQFSSPNAAFSGATPSFELNGGAIFSTEAGAAVRLAHLRIPWPPGVSE